ncbi:MAG: MBL fold metallo-hydrolase [Dysgonamonadaceae bacterium]|nr:MBL fold metallo-hydrolase [Dysgonamonadaceae bacterium]
MKIKTFEFSPIAVNTYVISDETGECAIIDAASFYADEKEELISYIKDNVLMPKHLLNTHLHFDHVFGVGLVEERFNLRMEAQGDDEFLLRDMPRQLQIFGFGTENAPALSIGKYLKDGDILSFGKQKLKVLEVPGHSPGSIAFYNEAAACVFTGDALFLSSIGRTDLPGGNYDQLIGSIREKLFSLPPETVVYPGHGSSTTIGYEEKSNPFFQ